MLDAAFLSTPASRSCLRRTRRSTLKCPLRPTILSCATEKSPASLPADIETSANCSLEEHGLILSSSVWRPPSLTVYIGRTDGEGTTSDDCAKASNLLSEVLDAQEFGFESYTLEVSTPGASDVLRHDYEFTAFHGFPIKVTTTEVFKKKQLFEGRLAGRTEKAVRVNLNGRVVNVPREIVAEVRLCEGKEE